MQDLTIHYANCRDKLSNCNYPHTLTGHDADTLRPGLAWDYMGAAMKNDYRLDVNFLWADCLLMDCDNDFSDEPADWVTPDDVCDEFPDVAFVVHYSRHNMVSKDGKEPRPKFHVLFPIHRTDDGEYYVAQRETLQRRWPKFCNGSMPCSHFFIGTAEPEVVVYDGQMTIDDYLTAEGVTIRRTTQAEKDAAKKAQQAAQDFRDDGSGTGSDGDVITYGNRHREGYQLTVKSAKRHGGDPEAVWADLCKINNTRFVEPLPEKDLRHMQENALKYFHSTIEPSADYVPPDEYGKDPLIPDDESDVGEADVFVQQYGDRLRYNQGLGWIAYDDIKWNEGADIIAQGYGQKLTADQLRLARSMLRQAQKHEADVAEGDDDDAKAEAKKQVQACMGFRRFVLDRRKTSRIAATLTEARPAQEVDISQLDADPYILNTPAGVVDLRDGSMREHDPLDYCTKCTAVSPGTEGADIWAGFLRQVTSGDDELARYLQEVAGMFLVGKVLREVLCIAYGSGGNGKSTYFNTLSAVMGDYSGGLSSDVLIVSNRGGKGAELATLRGKRLVVAAELAESTRLDTATVKKLCSTDPIRCEPKYKQPFDFTPSHSTVLYSNFLPRVGSSDSGTWSRLQVLPFKATFRGQAGEVLNYSDYLVTHAGGAVLQWMIDGAQAFLRQKGHIIAPACVVAAGEAYQRDNDWLALFIGECCDVADNLQTQSSRLYDAYVAFCVRNKFFCRNMADFRHAVDDAGYKYQHTNKGAIVHGLALNESAINAAAAREHWD